MKKDSKEEIVKAAISLFNSNGYAGTSIRDIAKEANVNSATIAYHFENKLGLLEYCFTYFFEQVFFTRYRGKGLFKTNFS
jgi:AcrR family transcriptional regulator